MSTESRGGRPRASSRETLAEAASELFLEQGYEATSIVDITTRAGVSRSSFFNYFGSKSDVLWGGLDAQIAVLADALAASSGPDADADVRAAVDALARELRPDVLALALAQSEAMGVGEELAREAGIRRTRIAEATGARLTRDGVDALRAEVLGAAYGGAVLAALARWAERGTGRTALAIIVRDALAVIPPAHATR